MAIYQGKQGSIHVLPDPAGAAFTGFINARVGAESTADDIILLEEEEGGGVHGGKIL
jgi:hypothetical protein